MPTLGGLETLERLNKHHPQARVLMLTMFNQEEYLLRTPSWRWASGYLAERLAGS